MGENLAPGQISHHIHTGRHRLGILPIHQFHDGFLPAGEDVPLHPFGRHYCHEDLVCADCCSFRLWKFGQEHLRDEARVGIGDAVRLALLVRHLRLADHYLADNSVSLLSVLSPIRLAGFDLVAP